MQILRKKNERKMEEKWKKMMEEKNNAIYNILIISRLQAKMGGGNFYLHI